MLLAYEVISASVCASIARSKRRDQGNWFIMGLLLGVIGIILSVVVGRASDENAATNNLLLDSSHHLRSGWKVLIFVLAILLVYILTAEIAELTHSVPPQSLLFLFYIDILVVTFLMLHFVDGRKLASVGFAYHGKILKEILLGFGIGAVMICLVGGTELAAGAIKLNMRVNLSAIVLLKNFLLSFIFFGFFAMGEELLFRGYPYQTLIQGTGAIGATIIMAVVFGAIHLANPDASLFSTLNTMLAGVWLSVAYLKKRTLYFPFGMHFSWNLVQSFFLSLPVSGLLTNRTIFIPTDYGPDWLTGGKYGPEAGIGTTVILVIAILYFLLDRRIRPAYDYVMHEDRVLSKDRDIAKQPPA